MDALFGFCKSREEWSDHMNTPDRLPTSNRISFCSRQSEPYYGSMLWLISGPIFAVISTAKPDALPISHTQAPFTKRLRSEATEKPPTPTCWGVYPLACHVTLYPGAKRGQVCTCVVTHVCVCSCRKLLIPAKWGHFRWSSQLQMTVWDFRFAIEDQFKVELKSELQSGFFFCDSWVAVDQGEGWGAFALQRLDVCILNVKSSFRKTPSINPFVSSLIN